MDHFPVAKHSISRAASFEPDRPCDGVPKDELTERPVDFIWLDNLPIGQARTTQQTRTCGMPHDLARGVDDGDRVRRPKEGAIRELRHFYRVPSLLGVEQRPAKLHQEFGAQNVVPPSLCRHDAPRGKLRFGQWNLAARERSDSQHVDEQNSSVVLLHGRSLSVN